eukprot:TRINITY_DN3686_c0_g1_i3.p1 TRINITY_DN3686_c0_g1~~TRINITY_DN3686_c0_g1_i3.p1  ORF type:complete len:221 (+),score=67.96 TRINITY_DN3686_c0_g1_i3:265-927(+)
MKYLLVVALVLASFTQALGGGALQFTVEPERPRCISEEVEANQMMIVDWATFAEDWGDASQQGHHLDLDIKMTNPNGAIVYQRPNLGRSGKFSHRAVLAGDYFVCLEAKLAKGATYVAGMKRKVSIHFKVGVEAKDYTGIAQKEHLKPIEIQMRKLEDLLKEAGDEMLYLRQREERMRDTNESTNSRVVWWSVFSVVILASMTVWQVYYLKKFFQQKKMI